MHTLPPALAPVASVSGLLYRAGVGLRNRAYSSGWLPSRRLGRPVVSVGNLTTGGTGKTPMVIHLAGMLGEAGYDVAILTRGYGRRDAKRTIVLPPTQAPPMETAQGGARETAPPERHAAGIPEPGDAEPAPVADAPDAATIGDEAALLRRRLPLAWMGVSADRFAAGAAILREAPRAVFILDDGFQHRRLSRNLDIVMIDGTAGAEGLGDGRLLPCGTLREPPGGLRRARVVVINGGADDAGADMELERRLRRHAPESVFFHCTQRIAALIPFERWSKPLAPSPCAPAGGEPPSPPRSAFLVAAIGNPGRFARDVGLSGVAVAGTRFFRDHATVLPPEWDACAAEAQAKDADAIVITEKDAVKVARPPGFPLLVAVQATELKEPARFREIVRSCI
ncbi:MAG: tetraacyldisaccharide 4'-kinase [Acidobacteriota bacterium]|jgi:tetraacyldisaccharide 4'-kinase|nr:tetraacyldisaccharide 4'-kinase [Acidobacteriota bacterium]